MSKTPGILRNTTGTVGVQQSEEDIRYPAAGGAIGGSSKPRFKGHEGQQGIAGCVNCGKPALEWGKDPCPGAKPPPDQYAAEYGIVEVFGHQRHIGRISEVERFGTKMLRVDEPTDVLHDANDMFAAGSTSYFLSGASIFRLTPCHISVVRLHYARRAPAVGYLAPPSRQVIDEAVRRYDEGTGDDGSEFNDENYVEDTADEVIEPAPIVSRETAGATLGSAHVKVEGATTCPSCGTPVADFDMVACYG